jgi:hypothetical protein
VGGGPLNTKSWLNDQINLWDGDHPHLPFGKTEGQGGLGLTHRALGSTTLIEVFLLLEIFQW